MFLACGAAYSLGEGTLGGVRLDSPPSALLRTSTYGNPDGVIASGGVFNTLKVLGPEEVGQGGLPHWAYAIRMDGLDASQVIWAYNRPPAAIGFLISGEGADAHVNGIVASLWKKLTTSSIVQTKKGIRLGDSFTKVLLKYGFPQTLAVMSAPIVQQRTTGLGALPAVAGMAGAPSLVSGYAAPGTAAPAMVPSAGPGAGLGVAAPGGYGRLPPATPAVGQSQEASGQFSGVIMGQSLSLSRHMVIGYPEQGLEFALYDMQVVRIQVFAVSLGAPGPSYAAGTTTAPAASAVRPTSAPVTPTPTPTTAYRRLFRPGRNRR
jgi:hypothetical protein